MVYLDANTGPVTQNARHETPELAFKGLESKRSASELVLNTVSSERQCATMSRNPLGPVMKHFSSARIIEAVQDVRQLEQVVRRHSDDRCGVYTDAELLRLTGVGRLEHNH